MKNKTAPPTDAKATASGGERKTQNASKSGQSGERTRGEASERDAPAAPAASVTFMVFELPVDGSARGAAPSLVANATCWTTASD